MQVVAETIDQNKGNVTQAVESLRLTAAKGQAEVDELLREAMQDTGEVAQTVNELTDCIKG